MANTKKTDAKVKASPKRSSLRVGFTQVAQAKHTFFLTKLLVHQLVEISYAAVRGDKGEEGAVQRILSSRRISSLRDFALGGGDYPTSVVLNWVGEAPLKVDGHLLCIPMEHHAAQIIDGQHRIAGLREAMKSKPSIGTREIPVSLYEGLDTRACADIFLSINTEQRPVAKSLVFDLFKVASKEMTDPDVVRADDLALALNEDTDSPYIGRIKFPGPDRIRGAIALSTVVSALRPLVEDKGVLQTYGVVELATQTKVIKNFFGALQDKYGGRWNEDENPFMTAAGFAGAVEFFKAKLIHHCNKTQDYTRESIGKALRMSPEQLILREDIKGRSGTAAQHVIVERLTEFFDPGVPAAIFRV